MSDDMQETRPVTQSGWRELEPGKDAIPTNVPYSQIPLVGEPEVIKTDQGTTKEIDNDERKEKTTPNS